MAYKLYTENNTPHRDASDLNKLTYFKILFKF